MRMRLLFGLLLFCVVMTACKPSGITLDTGPEEYELTLIAGSNGSLSAVQLGPYKRNQIVDLTALPDLGYLVLSWSGTMDDTSTNAQNHVRMTDDKTVRVAFQKAITLSGRATFDLVPATLPGGLDYTAISEEPVRGAVVEVRDQSDSAIVYSRAITDSNGEYAISAPESTAVDVVVLAALGTALTTNTRVLDNTNDNAEYGMFISITTGVVDVSGLDMRADSGWTGGATGSYTGTRAAGPFAILDVIYLGQQLVLAHDASAVFPALKVYWSINNDLDAGDLEDGDISTSFYQPSSNSLYILGAEDIDTDEYDAGVVAHEWAHYFEDAFSRSDSLGGGHGGTDILDPALAFSEGFANALSGIIRNTNLYIDTEGDRQGDIRVSLDLENDENGDGATVSGRLLDGYWSETSVQEVVYDIMDSDDDDADSVSLGIGPIYDAMTGAYKNSRAYATLPTFLHFVKLQAASEAAGIEAIANAENVLSGDEFDTGDNAIGMRMYTDLTLNILEDEDVDGIDLDTRNDFGPIDGVEDNKLYHRRFFKIENLSSGSYEIRMFETAGEIFYLDYPLEGRFGTDLAGDAYLDIEHSAGDLVFSVGTVGAPGTFSVQVVENPSTVMVGNN